MYFFSISPPGDKWPIQQKWFTEDTIKGWSKIFHLTVTNMAGVWLFCAAPVWLRDVKRWRSGLNWGAIGVPQGKWSHNQWLLPRPDPISGSPPSCPALPKCFVLRLPIYIVRSDYLFILKPLYFGLTLPPHTDSTKKLPAQVSGLKSIIFVQQTSHNSLAARTNR